MMKGILFHEGHDHSEMDIHFPDHHVDGAAADEDERSETWDFDNVELRTVGVDVGSSTSHLLFAHLHLQRLVQTSALHVGGRLVAFDEEKIVTRIEPSALLIARELGITLELGERLRSRDR